jgi:prepilin-type N-terminal cleavage/methylation domain-containing protein
MPSKSCQRGITLIEVLVVVGDAHDPSTARQCGFTLVEMLITLTVLAILAMVAVPTFRDLIGRSHVSSASNALSADLAYARIEVITRYVRVGLPQFRRWQRLHESVGSSYASGWLVYTYSLGTVVPGAAFARGAAGGILLRETTSLRGDPSRQRMAR